MKFEGLGGSDGHGAVVVDGDVFALWVGFTVMMVISLVGRFIVLQEFLRYEILAVGIVMGVIAGVIKAASWNAGTRSSTDRRRPPQGQ